MKIKEVASSRWRVASGNGLRTVALFIAFLVVTGTVLAVENAPVTVTPRGSDAWKEIEKLKDAGITVQILGKRREAILCPRPKEYPAGSTVIMAKGVEAAGRWLSLKEVRWNLLVPPALRFKPAAHKEFVEAVAEFNNFKVSWQKGGNVAVLYRGASDASIDEIRKGLSSEDAKVRTDAAWKAGWIEDLQTVPLLLTAAADQDGRVAGQAARSLCRLDVETVLTLAGDAAAPALKEGLLLSDPALRADAAAAISGVKPDLAAPLLEIALKDRIPEVRAAAAASAGFASDPKALAVLKTALSDESALVRAEAAGALGRLGTPDALGLARKAFEDKDAIVRKQAAAGLIHAGRDKALPLLEKALSHSDRAVRFEAVSALGLIGSDKALALLDKALSDKNRWVRYRALSALGRTGSSKAIPVLVKALGHEEERMRAEAAMAIGDIGGEEAAAALEKPLKDEDEGVRAKTAFALGDVGGKKAIALLKDALKDEDEDVRGKAAEALGKIGTEECLPLLEEALKDTEEGVRLEATAALGKTGGQQGVAILGKALGDKANTVKYAALLSLGEIGSPEALTLLEKAMESKNVHVQARAAFALGRIGGDTVLPIIDRILDRTAELVASSKGWGSRDKGFRENAIRALGCLSGKKPLDLLVKAADQDKTGRCMSRRHAVEAISKVNADTSQSMPAMDGAVLKWERTGSAAFVYRDTMDALIRIGPGPGALQILAEVIDYSSKQRRKGGFVPWRATFALGSLGGDRAVDLLQKLLQDKKQLEVTRWAAIDALVRIGGAKARDILLKELAGKDEKLKAHITEQLRLNFRDDPAVKEALAGDVK